jgi:hypothetical protein
MPNIGAGFAAAVTGPTVSCGLVGLKRDLEIARDTQRMLTPWKPQRFPAPTSHSP